MDRTSNPFRRASVKVLAPVGSFGTLDVWGALDEIDHLIEEEDPLAARQLLWWLGNALVRSALGSREDLDHWFLAHQVDYFIDRFEEETNGGRPVD